MQFLESLEDVRDCVLHNVLHVVRAGDGVSHTQTSGVRMLSGGGARGLAHVGVLKMLEREHIPIDVIAGTSMGAIVGGLYASGMSAEQIEAQLMMIKWDEVFANRVERPLLSQRRKEEDFQFSPVLEFGMREGELRAPLGALSGRGLETLLRRYTMPVRGVHDFSRLPIPFRAVATNMETGAPVILAQGDLALALRSSMSVPGVFAPTELDGLILGDGALVDNLPIDVAHDMGADVVIAVNIGSPLAARETLASVGGLTGQMISILTEQNVQRSLALLGEVVALDSDSSDHCGDFTRLDQLAATVRAVAPQLIVNAAAHTAVDKAEVEGSLARTINALAPGVLADEAQRLGA